jgi:hypothetical protein
MKKWIVAFFDQKGEVIGPAWNVDSKIKPTRWAQRAYPGTVNLMYKIKEVEDFDYKGYKDSFLKAM